MKLTQSLRKTGPLLILGAAVLWALDGVIRRNLFELPAIIIVFYEHLIGLVILLPFILPVLLKTKLTKKEWGLIALVSFLSGLLGTLWFTSALAQVNFISFSVVFLLQKLQPVFATLAAVIFLKEKVTKGFALWAIVAMVSAYFVTFPLGVVDLTTGAGTVMAALLALGAAFAWGTSTAFSKMALKEKPFEVMTAYRFLLTTIFAFIAVFVLGAGASLTAVTLPQGLQFAAIAISTGMVALLLYYKGLKQTEAKISTILELAFPALAVAIDALLYGHYLLPTQLFAAFILLVSFFLISKQNYKDEVH